MEAERRIEADGDGVAVDDEGQLLRDEDFDSFSELEVAHILPHSLSTMTANLELVSDNGGNKVRRSPISRIKPKTPH